MKPIGNPRTAKYRIMKDEKGFYIQSKSWFIIPFWSTCEIESMHGGVIQYFPTEEAAADVINKWIELERMIKEDAKKKPQVIRYMG